MTESRVNTQAAARKRQEIGLDPQRETAQTTVARPPQAANEVRWMEWILVALIVALLVITVLLAGAKLAGVPTDWLTLRAQVESFFSAVGTQGSASSASTSFEDEFESEPGLLVRDFQPNRWTMGVIVDEGVYRIRMYPEVVAWSTLGLEGLENYRFSTSMKISAETPWGYGGVIGRYVDLQNFYLALVDGVGRYRVQVQQDGLWTTLIDWTTAPAIAPAGQANTLTVEDAGEVVRFLVNEQIIFQTRAIALPPGDVGVMAGSQEEWVAEVDFDWIRLAALAQ